MGSRVIFTGFGKTAEANGRAIIRRVRGGDKSPDRKKKIYLTFDDGPDPLGTPAVLDVLAKHQAKATFFVVAEKTSRCPELITQLVTEEHAIGNHSLDHGYRLFFAKAAALSTWITQSEIILRANGITDVVGFRPPAGLCTPPLFEALRERNEPLILWSHRFFDTQRALTEKRMREVLPQLRNGDILLLHDQQKPTRLREFIRTLDLFIFEAARLGFQCERLSRDLCQQQSFVQNQ